VSSIWIRRIAVAGSASAIGLSLVACGLPQSAAQPATDAQPATNAQPAALEQAAGQVEADAKPVTDYQPVTITLSPQRVKRICEHRIPHAEKRIEKLRTRMDKHPDRRAKLSARVDRIEKRITSFRDKHCH
jgi:predicted GTPase